MSPEDLALGLAEAFIKSPETVEPVARELGLWDALVETLAFPLRKAHCQLDPAEFIEYCFVDPQGQPLVLKDFHREWLALMVAPNEDDLIGAPRAHGKSVLGTGYCSWSIGKNPNVRIKIVGASDDKAEEVLSLIRVNIETNERIRDIFPNLSIDDNLGSTKSKFFVKRGIVQRDATVEATGVMSSGAGGRADILLCDDVVDYNNAITNPSMRVKVLGAVMEIWFKLVSSFGKIIWLSTPYHVMDATNQLKSKPAWVNPLKVWWKPAEETTQQLDEKGNQLFTPILNEAGEPTLAANGTPLLEPVTTTTVLWPEVWPLEKLKVLRAADPRSYSRQYLLNALSDDERTFPDEVLKRSYLPDFGNIGEGIPDHWPTFGGIDLASSMGVRAAFTVIFTLARCPDDRRLYLKELVRRRMSFTETMTEISDAYDKHKWHYALVENNGYQKAVEDALDKEHKHIPISGFTTGSNKANELVGLPGLCAAINKGTFAFPSARFPLHEDDQSPIGLLWNELTSHPGGKFKDIIMALWFAWRASEEGAGNFAEIYVELAGMTY